MRFGTLSGGAGSAPPFAPFAPGGACVFTRNMENHPLASNQAPAKRTGNQLSYADPAYSYDGEAAPKFYGYSGTGYGGYSKGYSTVANIGTFTPSIFIVPPGQPTEKVTLVN